MRQNPMRPVTRRTIGDSHIPGFALETVIAVDKRLQQMSLHVLQNHTAKKRQTSANAATTR